MRRSLEIILLHFIENFHYLFTTILKHQIQKMKAKKLRMQNVTKWMSKSWLENSLQRKVSEHIQAEFWKL